MSAYQESILNLARRRGLIRSCDLDEWELPRVELTRLVRKGLLERRGRGLYTIPTQAKVPHLPLATMACKHPKSIVCLFSALHFHGLIADEPSEVWLAIPNKARRPAKDRRPLQIVRFSGAAWDTGVEEHDIAGITVRVTSVAKTIADCFKYRNKIGLYPALDALAESWKTRRIGMDELWHCATACRVTNVIRPYMDSLLRQ